jgi:hypothetical protein
VVSVVVQTGTYCWQFQRMSSSYDQKPRFPWDSLTISLVSGLLYLIPAYLLIRWLYYEPATDVETATDPDDEHPVDGQE